MSRILANALVLINSIFGFLVIIGSIAIAYSFYVKISSGQIAQADLFETKMLMIVTPIVGIVLAAYACGMIALLALIESHLKAIKEQGERRLRGLQASSRAEPKLGD